MHIVIVRALTAGGHGDVFLGRRSDNEQLVVIKFLREYQLTDARRRFAREVRILRRKLRGIVQLLWFDVEGPRPYYVMPFLERGALTQYAGRLTNDQLNAIALEAAAALAQLHGVNISHGDVKPDNLLVADDDHLALADPLGNGWGCTVVFSEEHGGTPGYWAPEVAKGGKITQEGDSYSLGATLYHLASGKAPRDGEIIDATPLAQRFPNIAQIVKACCNADPHARPSARDVLSMLKGESWLEIQETRLKWKVGLTIAGIGLVAAMFLDDAA